MPVCSRMEYLVRFATTVGMSAAVIVFSADVRFCTWLLMTLLAAVSRLTLAPNVPRTLAMFAMAASMSVIVDWASDWVLKSAPAAFRFTELPPLPLVIPAVVKAPIWTEIWLDPIEVASLRKILVGAATLVEVGLLRVP